MKNRFFYTLGLEAVTVRCVLGCGKAVELHPRAKEWEKLRRHREFFCRVTARTDNYERVNIKYICRRGTRVDFGESGRGELLATLTSGDGQSMRVVLKKRDRDAIGRCLIR